MNEAQKQDQSRGVRGRGASINPKNRFEKLEYSRDESDDFDVDCHPSPRTQFIPDSSRSIIAYNDSPDVGFSASFNPYRGCEHGCIYCYARPTHEYLGYSAGLDFETKILVKEQAPQLLKEELLSPKWQPQPLGVSGVTDPYQPVESKLKLTRRCLEVAADFRNPVVIIAKNHLVTRDVDVLERLARFDAIQVNISITTLDPHLAHVMEPRTSPPERRLAAIRELTERGIPAGVLAAPVIPGLTDHETSSIIHAAARAGANRAGYVVLRLPYAVSDLFQQWLEEHFPDRKNKILSHIRDLRGGRLNDPDFKSRMRGEGPYADQIASTFRLACKRAGIQTGFRELSTAEFRRPGAQMSLFDE